MRRLPLLRILVLTAIASLPFSTAWAQRPEPRGEEQCNIAKTVDDWGRNRETYVNIVRVMLNSFNQSVGRFQSAMSDELGRIPEERRRAIDEQIKKFADVSGDNLEFDNLLFDIAAATSNVCYYCRLYPTWKLFRDIRFPNVPESVLLEAASKKEDLEKLRLAHENLMREQERLRINANDPEALKIIDGWQNRLAYALAAFIPKEVRESRSRESANWSIYYSNLVQANAPNLSAVMNRLQFESQCAQSTPQKRF